MRIFFVVNDRLIPRGRPIPLKGENPGQPTRRLDVSWKSSFRPMRGQNHGTLVMGFRPQPFFLIGILVCLQQKRFRPPASPPPEPNRPPTGIRRRMTRTRLMRRKETTQRLLGLPPGITLRVLGTSARGGSVSGRGYHSRIISMMWKSEIGKTAVPLTVTRCGGAPSAPGMRRHSDRSLSGHYNEQRKNSTRGLLGYPVRTLRVFSKRGCGVKVGPPSFEQATHRNTRPARKDDEFENFGSLLRQAFQPDTGGMSA